MAWRMSRWRTVAAVLGVGLLGMSGWCAWRAHLDNRDFHDAFTRTLATGEIDLSRTGMTRLSFEHSYPTAHGIGLFVVLPDEPTDVGDRRPKECNGLGGRVSITDAAGQSAWTAELDPVIGSLPPQSPAATADGRRAIELTTIDVLPMGRHTLTVEVTRTAWRLAGVPQRLEARYRLCGLEQMAALVEAGAAVVCGLLAPGCGVVWLSGRTRPTAGVASGGAKG